ncbi:MAG TPA: PaaI family thioesterase [Thermoplasmata archaeon]|nr:PaaI family thioesterase [Thermoplasmata archaeon]
MTDDSDPRTRLFRWPDPKRFDEPVRTLSGLEFMRAFLSGKLPAPPFMELLGIRIVSVEPSSVAFEFEPAEFMYSPLGNVHGGIVTVLLDTAMGCSFHTTLPVGVGYTTLELKVNFLRPVTAQSGTLRAEGHVVHSGSRVATTDARLSDRSGRLHAHATSTLLILRPESRPGSAPG